MQGFLSAGMHISIQCDMKSKSDSGMYACNKADQITSGQRSGHEDNHVNSLHSVYKRRGKYSTSSEFKTQVMQEKPQMPF